MTIRTPRRTLAATCGLLVATTSAVLAQALPVSASGQATASTYIVLYKAGASSSDAGTTVRQAGGTLVASYRQIGVAVARSADAGFASAVTANSKVSAASRTDALAQQGRVRQTEGRHHITPGSRVGRLPLGAPAGHSADPCTASPRHQRRQ